jgi:competence protein CoiA
MEQTEVVPVSPPAGKAAPKAAVPRCRRAGGPCTCPQPQLVVTISGRQYPAEPSSRMGPAAALYTASCTTCGGPYDNPWRRVRP